MKGLSGNWSNGSNGSNRRSGSTLRNIRALSGVALMIAMTVAPARAATIDLPDAQPLLRATATGEQLYSCEYDANHVLGWVFKAPRATLFDASGAPIIQHSAGPSWQATDGSRIEGRVLAQRPSDAPDSVPELLLETHSTGASGVLAAVGHVQRVRTIGGVKPQTPCTQEHESAGSHYSATYIFYR
jgi:hypothetical protein